MKILNNVSLMGGTAHHLSSPNLADLYPQTNSDHVANNTI